MDPAMPLGFLENTQEIYAEVASYSVVPPEKIKQYWNAYTTTFRRLFDPSAFRLENFWWHVWGSERLRNLSGPALAKLFEEFSTGPTFVPLPPPTHAFRFSKPPVSRRRRADESGAESAQHHDASRQGSAPTDNKKGLTPSSTRPPPPHPILKKSRGPSASGPRPTARFASPPTTGDEAKCSSDAISAKAAAAAAMPPPPLPSRVKKKHAVTAPSVSPVPKEPEPSANEPSPVSLSPAETGPRPPIAPAKGGKSAPNPARKVVASTAVARRKPVLVRRPSSQSSAGSESGPRAAGPAASSRRGGSKRTAGMVSQSPGQGSSSSQTSDSGLMMKAAAKPPAKPTPRSTPQSVQAQTDGEVGEAAPPPPLRPPSPQRRSTWDVRDTPATAAPAPPPVAGFVADQPIGRRVPSIMRSRSRGSDSSQASKDRGVALLPAQPTSSVATFTTTARGQFDSETITTDPVVPEARDVPDPAVCGATSPPNVLQPLRPTPPNTAPPIPFGRSKSELTLLLARGKPQKSDDS